MPPEVLRSERRNIFREPRRSRREDMLPLEVLRSGDDEKLLGIMRIVIKDNLHGVLRSSE
jgi:hypothetical protein